MNRPAAEQGAVMGGTRARGAPGVAESSSGTVQLVQDARRSRQLCYDVEGSNRVVYEASTSRMEEGIRPG
jgi:hypothetical protein